MAVFFLFGKQFITLFFSDDQKIIHTSIETKEAQTQPTIFESRVEFPYGQLHWVRWTNSCVVDSDGKFLEYQAIGYDVTNAKRMAQEREELLTHLKDSLAKNKILTGLLPICANCKKIRNDQGYWNVVEQYITEHTDATFSHGICPECAKELYPNRKHQ